MCQGLGLLRVGFGAEEEPADGRELGQESNDLHLSATVGTEQGVELIHFSYQASPTVASPTGFVLWLKVCGIVVCCLLTGLRPVALAARRVGIESPVPQKLLGGVRNVLGEAGDEVEYSGAA